MFIVMKENSMSQNLKAFDNGQFVTESVSSVAKSNALLH